MVRVKYRYILLEIITKDFGNEIALELPVCSKSIYFSIKNAVRMLYGDYGLGVLQIGTTVKYLNRFTRIVIVRAKRNVCRVLCTSVPFVKTINRRPFCFRTLHIAGTLRSTHKYLRSYFHRELAAILRKSRSEDERSRVKEEITKSLDSFIEGAANTF